MRYSSKQASFEREFISLLSLQTASNQLNDFSSSKSTIHELPTTRQRFKVQNITSTQIQHCGYYHTDSRLKAHLRKIVNYYILRIKIANSTHCISSKQVLKNKFSSINKPKYRSVNALFQNVWSVQKTPV